jgi:hypothetical protein
MQITKKGQRRPQKYAVVNQFAYFGGRFFVVYYDYYKSSSDKENFCYEKFTTRGRGKDTFGVRFRDYFKEGKRLTAAI